MAKREEKALSSNYFIVCMYCCGGFPFELLAMDDIVGAIIIRFG